jgi:hypothetical protein
MDIKLAFDILEIEDKNISLENLKKKYHNLALKNHPDKNKNDENATIKFQLISEAYTLLYNEINKNKEYDGIEENGKETGYINILQMFLNGLLNNDYILSIIKNIVMTRCLSIKIIEELDKAKLILLYNILIKYKNLLYIEEIILEQIKGLILEKYKDIQIYILNPSINDLLENNVYKLEINNYIYFVPLWYNELVFDNNSGGTDNIIVKCIPCLPENITIDDNNNLIVNLNYSINSNTFNEENIQFLLGKKIFYIPISQLFMKRKQTFYLKKQGLSKIYENNIYNIDEKNDIIIKLHFL